MLYEHVVWSIKHVFHGNEVRCSVLQCAVRAHLFLHVICQRQCTALYFAAKQGDNKTAQQLLDAKADVNVCKQVHPGGNTLQHIATHCNTLQHIATRVHYTATHCQRPQTVAQSLRHIATHCNTLQHIVTHCNARAIYFNTPSLRANRCTFAWGVCGRGWKLKCCDGLVFWSVVMGWCFGWLLRELCASCARLCCCSVLQCVAVSGSVLQCFLFQCVAVGGSVWQCVAVQVVVVCTGILFTSNGLDFFF